jgi:alcohol dehydrogenase (cytochrome c)
VGGGTNWQNAAFDEARGLFLVHATEGASVFTKAEVAERGERGFYAASAGSQPEPMIPVVRALDAATGAKKWEYFSPPLSDISFALGGLLATKGGVAFGASGGTAFGLDSRSGREVWRATLGGDTRAPVISFMLDGRQVIAVSSGRTLFVFGL